MLRAEARALLWMCGLGSLIAAIACVAPHSHNEPSAQRARADCSGCHEREYRQAPLHVDAKPTRCAACHSESSWRPVQLSHSWPLTGAHAQANCAACHKGWSPQYEHTTSACIGCHHGAYDLAQASAQKHEALSSNCQDCHNTSSWRPATQPAPAAPPPLQQLVAATPPAAAPEPSSPPREPVAPPVPQLAPAAKRERRARSAKRTGHGAQSKSEPGTPQATAQSSIRGAQTQARPKQAAASPVGSASTAQPVASAVQPPAAQRSSATFTSRAARASDAPASQPARANTSLTAATARSADTEVRGDPARTASTPPLKPSDGRKPRPGSAEGPPVPSIGAGARAKSAIPMPSR